MKTFTDINFIDNTITERNFTEEELTFVENTNKMAQIRQAEVEAKAQAKAQAEAKLLALGLSTDDLAALGLAQSL